LNAHTPSEKKSDDSKESCYEELKQVFDHIVKYYIKILLRYLNTVLGKEVRSVGIVRSRTKATEFFFFFFFFYWGKRLY